MKRFALPILLAALPFAAADAGEEALIGQALHSAVAGKTVYISTPMGEVPIRYAANGQVSGRTELALLDGETTTKDSGRWWVADSKLCIRWNRWMSGETHCFTMKRVSPTEVYWRRDDGKSGRARLG